MALPGETITNMTYNPTTRVLSYVNEAGTVQTATLSETVTTLSYDAATKVLTYMGENGIAQTVDLSALATDIFVNAATFNATSGVLTLIDNDGATPNVTVNLSALKPTLVDNLNDTWTHTVNGVATVIDASISVAAIPVTGNYDGRIIEFNNRIYKYLAVPGTYIEVS